MQKSLLFNEFNELWRGPRQNINRKLQIVRFVNYGLVCILGSRMYHGNDNDSVDSCGRECIRIL